MSVIYQPATLSDAHNFARCQVEAFMEDEVHQTATGVTPNASQGVLQENVDYRAAKYERRIANQHIHWIKAVDATTGALAGFSGWEEPENRKSDEVDCEKTLEWPSNWNMEFAGRMEEKMAAMKKSVLGERKDVWYVAMLAVSPAYRGRGIAQQLIKRGVELADQAGESMYLESSPVARKLYERNGFEQVAEFEMPKGYHVAIMLRKPKSRE